MISLSLKWRVSLWVSTVLVAVIATICIVAYVEFEESHLRNIDRTLSAMANGILASLHEREGEEQMIGKDIDAVMGTSGQNPSTFYRIWMMELRLICLPATRQTANMDAGYADFQGKVARCKSRLPL